MRVRATRILAVSAALLVAGYLALGHARRSRSSSEMATDSAAPTARMAVDDAATREADISFYERRVSNDPESAADRVQLAGLYLERGRATGSFQDFDRAERVARRSLALRTSRNAQAYGLLATALLARHAFVEARDAAERAVALAPGLAGPLAQLAEIELELGDYDAANRHYASIRVRPEQHTLAARVARWHEVMGRVSEARRLLEGAVRSVSARDDLAREQVAWFHYRLGEFELRAGNHAAAEVALRRGLAIAPEDHRILAVLSRLALVRRQFDSAVVLGEQATALILDPGTLATVSEAYAALGDTVQARSYATAMTTAALQQPGPIHRAWGHFLLDYGTVADAKLVLSRAQQEIRTRRDVYGHDLLAWALYRTGRVDQAAESIERALAQGTRDPQLVVHAMAIRDSACRGHRASYAEWRREHCGAATTGGYSTSP